MGSAVFPTVQLFYALCRRSNHCPLVGSFIGFGEVLGPMRHASQVGPALEELSMRPAPGETDDSRLRRAVLLSIVAGIGASPEVQSESIAP